MVEEYSGESKKNLTIIAVLVLVMLIAVSCVFVFAFDIFDIMPGNNNNNNKNVDTSPQITTEYSALSAEAAYDFINTTTHNLTIIDARDCKCNYDTAHIGAPPDFEAIHSVNWKTYYNTTDDILVYDNEGDNEAIEYCENLVNHTYGKLFYLESGYSAWSQANYPFV